MKTKHQCHARATIALTSQIVLALASLLFPLTSQADLIGYWPANEGSGTTMGNQGSAGGSLNVTLTGVNWGAGLSGEAGDFAIDIAGTTDADGNNNSTAGMNPPPFPLSHFTVTGWINGVRTGNDSGLFFARGASSGGSTGATGINYRAGTNELGYTYETGAGNTWRLQSGLFLTDNEWTFIAWVVTPDSNTLYVGNPDGGGLESTTFAAAHPAIADMFAPVDGRAPNINDANTWYFGWDPIQQGRSFQGLMDEFSLWDEALNSGDIQELYDGSATPATLSASRAPTIAFNNFVNGDGGLDPSAGLDVTITANSGATIDNAGITMTVDDVDVTGDLTITGSDTEKNFNFGTLELNMVYIGVVTATDSNGNTTTESFSVDTYGMVIEAEDFNFGGGQYFDDPDLCNDFSADVDNCYYDRASVPNVDAVSQDANGVNVNTDFINTYRFQDLAGNFEDVDTQTSKDVLRHRFATAPAGANGAIRDYDVVNLDPGDFMNYTRTFPDGNYFIYLRMQSFLGIPDGALRIGKVTSDPSVANQTVEPIGEFNSGVTSGFEYVQAINQISGTPVTVNLSGVETLRLSMVAAAGELNINAIVLVPTEESLQAPTVTMTAPEDGGLFGTGEDITVSADASDADGTVAQVEFFYTLNGVTTSIETVTEAPYTVVWAAPEQGEYVLSAEATDDDGLVTGTDNNPTIIADSTPPGILAIQNGPDLNTIEVTFNEAVDPATAEDASNYSSDPSAGITGAQLAPGGHTVILTTGDLTDGAEYTVTVNGVADLFGNAITEAVSQSFVAGAPVSIAINFGADEPRGTDPDPVSYVDGPAGVLQTANWNNFEGANGDSTDTVIVADVDGAPMDTGISIDWSSNNTWYSTDTTAPDGDTINMAPEGEDRDLMTGYLDTNNDSSATVNVSGIPFDVYDVIIYVLSDNNTGGRGGVYTIGDVSITHRMTASFDGTYVESTPSADDPTILEGGTYFVFRGVTGSSFTLMTDATMPATGTQRAPYDGIEIVSTQRAALEQPDPLQFGQATIAIKFAADDPSLEESSVNGPAGVRRVANWNNLQGASGSTDSGLLADVGGSTVETSANVTWSAAGTWRSNQFTEEAPAAGDDRALLTGYLDTNNDDPIMITVDDVPFPVYDVYVYILSDNSTSGRGGPYTIGDTTIIHRMTAQFGGEFVESMPTMDDPPIYEGGHYIVFRGVSGSSFTLTADPTLPEGATQRAPVNAIEIVNAVPTSLAVKFAADEPEGTGSTVDGPAGVLGTGFWNNVETEVGEQADLVVDLGGTALETQASVTWSAAGTWRSNQFTEDVPAESEDRDLLTGYLDTNNDDPIMITVENVPFNAYDVYVYILSDNSTSGRGGPYTIGDTTIVHRMTAQFGGEFVESMPSVDDPSISEGGHYIVFRGMTGSEFTLTADPTLPEGATQRAPVNAIEIVPAAGVAPGGGGGGVLLTISANGDGTVTIGWSGGGTLQMTPTLSPADWQDVANQTNPYTIDATTGDAFFRVAQ